MTTLSTSPSATAPGRSGRPGGPVTFRRVVASEWIKLRTVRSTLWMLGVTVALMVAVSVIAAWGTSSMASDAGAAGTVTAPELLSAAWPVAQLTVAVLGVLTVTGEYSTGMVRSTFAAVPRRVPALLAKAVVLTAVIAVTAVVAMVLSYVATLPFHDDLGVELDLSDPGALRLLAALPLYLVGIGLLALAIGALVRNTAAGLAIVLGLVLVVENVFANLPVRFFEVLSPFLPATAGSRLFIGDETLAMMAQVGGGTQLGPWQGYAVLVGWVVLLLGVALVLLRRRDA